MKKCSFLIVCLWLVACSAPRQVTLQLPQVITLVDTVFVNSPVPSTSNTGQVVFDDFSPLDSFTVQDSFSFATVVVRHDTLWKTRTYTVTHGRKADTVQVMVPVTIRDTIRIECPPTLPAMPTNGKFPWWWLLGLFGALSVWWAGKRLAKK